MQTRRRLIASATALAVLGMPARAHAAWDKGEAVTLPPLTFLDGSVLDPSSLKGKVVVLEFWASWCPYCAKQNPLIEALHREHQARGLEVVAVSIDKTAKAASDYLKARGYTFKAGMATPAYEAIRRLRKGLPQTYVIGRDGRIRQIEMGEMFEEEIRAFAQYL
jgi:thiol-disulfide isomerase/thioredoxin